MPRSLKDSAILCLTVAAVLSSAMPCAQAQTPSAKTPRVMLPKQLYRGNGHATKTVDGTLIVKLREGVDAVLLPSRQLVLDTAYTATDAPTVERELAEINRLLGQYHAPLTPLFREPRATLKVNKRSGEANSGRALASLELYFELAIPDPSTAAELGDKLNELSIVEAAYAPGKTETPGAYGFQTTGAAVCPAAGGTGLPTPALDACQGYLNAAPTGVNARYAWGGAGGQGQGVRIIDVEFSWELPHEDLAAPFVVLGPNPTTGDTVHGLLVLGILAAENNGFGMTGVAPQASIGLSPATTSAAPAITAAAAQLRPGDIIQLELQGDGPGTPLNCVTPPGGSVCNAVPVEWDQATFDAISAATANGIIVIEAAGNNPDNLDDPRYMGLFDRAVRDSGAIIVGAGNTPAALTGPAGSPETWSVFGSRVDLQGWGDSVASLGQGQLYQGSQTNPATWYYGNFGGTSAATPIVTGAAADLQGVQRAFHRPVLTPIQMRHLLVATGTPQGQSTSHIGPLPNLQSGIIGVVSGYPTLPFVNLIAPTRTNAFASASLIAITADAAASYSKTIAKVEFFASGKKLGEVDTAPYTLVLQNLLPGIYPVTAKATDSRGFSAVSDPLAINVSSTLPPAVSITPPAAPVYDTAPFSIGVSAMARQPGASITKVDLYANGGFVGELTAPPFNFSLPTEPKGVYTFTATATETVGGSATSAAVPVNVVVPPPTVTIIVPRPAAGFIAPANVLIGAKVAIADGSAAGPVTFYQNDPNFPDGGGVETAIGQVASLPYTFTAKNLSAGTHNVQASASTSSTSRSNTIQFTVNPGPLSPLRYATFYTGCNFSTQAGPGVLLPPGSYTQAQLGAMGLTPDTLASMRIRNGFEAALYPMDNFGGTPQIYRYDQRCLTGAAPTSSVIIRVSTALANQLVDGVYEIYTDQGNTGQVLNVQGASLADGAPIEQRTEKYSVTSQWVLRAQSDGSYLVTELHSGKVLAVRGSLTTDGAPIEQETLTNAANQHWYIEPVDDPATNGFLYSSFRFISKNSGEALDVPGGWTADGIVMDQWTEYDNPNQLYFLSWIGIPGQ